MLRTAAICVGALVLANACAVNGSRPTPVIEKPDQDRLAAQAHNEENCVRTYVERYQEAKGKATEYRGYVASAEGELDKLSTQLHSAREQTAKRSQELATVRDESKKLEADLSTAKQELQKLQAQAHSEEQSRADMTRRLEGLRSKNSQHQGKIEALLKELGAP
jgi:chromosome segregation ATPase